MIGTGIPAKPQGQKEGITNNCQIYSQVHRTYLDDSVVTPKNGQRKNHIVNSFGQTILTPLTQKAKGITGGESQKTTPVPNPLQHVTVEQMALEQESPFDTTMYLCTGMPRQQQMSQMYFTG